ncbi:hypothetical protein [Rosettibacter firmus]|uniref:hypothetical protein n=1 Tax=Rosettibacter firmus TaxID=3111522 RepID=UPI00336C0E36
MIDRSQLLVLTSILYGLAIARYFDLNSKYFYNKNKIVFEWLITGWSILAFLFMVRTWWEYANTSALIQISFFNYIEILTVAIILYIQSTLLTPDIPKDELLDLKKHYLKISPYFFGSILLIFLKNQITRLFTNVNEIFSLLNYIRLIFIVCLLIMIINKNRIFHIIMFFVSAVLYLSFVILAK